MAKFLTTEKKSNTLFCSSYLKKEFWNVLNIFQCKQHFYNYFPMKGFVIELVFFFSVLQTLYLKSR